jgi:hypothetical protein
VIDHRYRDGKLVLWWRVLPFVGFDDSLNFEPVLSFAAIGRVTDSIQFEGLADRTKRDLNGASSDFRAVPVVAVPDPVSESEKEFDAVGVWQCGEQGVHTTERGDVVEPKTPIALPFVVIRSHDPSVDVSPRSSEKIRELSLLLTRKPRHEAFCKGKESENFCKNSSSDRVNVSDVADVPRNVREAMSAI